MEEQIDIEEVEKIPGKDPIEKIAQYILNECIESDEENKQFIKKWEETKQKMLQIREEIQQGKELKAEDILDEWRPLVSLGRYSSLSKAESIFRQYEDIFPKDTTSEKVLEIVQGTAPDWLVDNIIKRIDQSIKETKEEKCSINWERVALTSEKFNSYVDSKVVEKLKELSKKLKNIKIDIEV